LLATPTIDNFKTENNFIFAATYYTIQKKSAATSLDMCENKANFFFAPVFISILTKIYAFKSFMNILNATSVPPFAFF